MVKIAIVAQVSPIDAEMLPRKIRLKKKGLTYAALVFINEHSLEVAIRFFHRDHDYYNL